MEAKELRIGNYVRGGNDPEMSVASIDEVNGVELGFIGMELREAINYGLWHYSFYSLKPIPLTEEWLLKFGFENTMKEEYKKVWDSLIDSFWIEWNKTFSIYAKYNGQPIRNIKYVHQLQNLYFALTGEELTIKDNGNN